MYKFLRTALMFFGMAVVLGAVACTSQGNIERQTPTTSTTSDETATAAESSDILYYDPNECSSSDADDGPFCDATAPDWTCDVLEASVDDGYNPRMVLGDNAEAVLARTYVGPAESLWRLAIMSLLDDMPSVYITLEEMPDNEFGFAFETPRLEWIDGTTSNLRMTRILASDTELDELTTYDMTFEDEDGRELSVIVTFDC